MDCARFRQTHRLGQAHRGFIRANGGSRSLPLGFHMQHSLVPQAAAKAEEVILAFLKPSSF